MWQSRWVRKARNDVVVIAEWALVHLPLSSSASVWPCPLNGKQVGVREEEGGGR